MTAIPPRPLTRAAAPPLRPEDRWPIRTLALLERDLADAERSRHPGRAAAAAEQLEAERDYLAALGTTFLHHALGRRPHAATAELTLPVDGLRDDVLTLVARLGELEAVVARLERAVDRITAARGPAGEDC